MAALTEADIERLLSEAEARLAGNESSNKAITVVAPASKANALASVATPSTASGEPSKAEKLTMRVPQVQKKDKGPKDNAGADWYNMPRTELTPQLKRDLQVLRMRDVIAMGKQHFKKDNRKDFVPEYCQVGTIIAGAADGSSQRLTRKEKKRTIVEEVLSAENASKFKSKFHEIQEKKMSGKKGFYKKVVAGRRKRP
ncbi:Fcf2 pre-rRNA processing-domain-containing protein [Cladorrhinum samala]|uniref:Fcf2 pre-rRNA processing-domain-containing protein n=1 Tax=Cladorrhinum samala TaxID=585594 RepID=A0AAV9HP52_9PEZI|nr:Fcf2 pre-rRNA processing-domain-containing protein [Cladorrhinum samala]